MDSQEKELNEYIGENDDSQEVTLPSKRKSKIKEPQGENGSHAVIMEDYVDKMNKIKKQKPKVEEEEYEYDEEEYYEEADK